MNLAVWEWLHVCFHQQKSSPLNHPCPTPPTTDRHQANHTNDMALDKVYHGVHAMTRGHGETEMVGQHHSSLVDLHEWRIVG